MAHSNCNPLVCLRVGKAWERRRESRNLLGIILIRVLCLAAGTDQLLFCRAALPRVPERRIARQSRCWPFPDHHAGGLSFTLGRKVNEPAVPPNQAEGSNLRKSSEKQNHLGLETRMAV